MFRCCLRRMKNSWFNQVGLFVHLLSFLHNETVHICVCKLFLSGTGSCLQFLLAVCFHRDFEFLFPSLSFLGVLLTSHFQPVPQFLKNISCRSFLQGAFPCCIKKFSSEHCKTLLDSLCPTMFFSQ